MRSLHCPWAACVALFPFLCTVGEPRSAIALGGKRSMHTAAVTSIAADADNRYLVTGSEDKTVKIWDLSTGQLVRVVTPPAGKGPEGKIFALALSPDGKTIACGGYTGYRRNPQQGGKTYSDVYIFARDSGKLLHKLPVPYVVEGLVYSPDGALLLATSLGAFDSTSTDFGADRTFTTADYQWAKNAYPSAGAAATFADIDRHGRLLLIQKFGVWTAEVTGQGAHESREIPGVPGAVKFSPDGAKIAIAFADATVGVYSGEDLSLLYTPDVKGIGPAEVEFNEEAGLADASRSTVAWSSDGQYLYFAGGRTCARGSCFIRKWSDGGRGSFTDVPAARSRITHLAALQRNAVAYAAADPAFGILDAQDRRILFVSNAEHEVAAPKQQGIPRIEEPTPESARPTLPVSAFQELTELHQHVVALESERRYLEALPLARRAVERVHGAVESRDPAAAQPLIDLAHVQYALGEYRRTAGESPLEIQEYREARALYEQALAIREHSLGPNRPEVGEVLDDLGALLRAAGEYDAAADVFQRVLALRRNALGPDHPETAKSMNDLAAARVLKYASSRRLVDAFVVAQKAVDDVQRALGPDHPSVGLALANLAELYRSFRASYVSASAALHERALAIRQRSFGPDHWDVATSLYRLGDVYLAQRQYDKALDAYARVSSIEEKVLGANAPALATFTRRLAGIYRSLGQYVDAERLYRRVLAVREQQGEAYLIAGALEDLGDLYRSRGQHAKAEPLFVRVLSIREQNLGPNHFKVAETLRKLGTVYRVNGEYAKAQPLYERAVAIHQQDGGDVAASWALRDAAALAAAQQDVRTALRLVTQSLVAQEPTLQILFRPDREEKQLEAEQSRYVSGAYFFLLGLVSRHFKDDRQTVRNAMELILRRKGIVFDAQSIARASPGRLSQAGRETRAQLSAARAELAALLLNKPSSMDEEEYRKKLVLVFEQNSTLEAAVANLSSATTSEFFNQNVTVDAVAAALPQGSALVEFVKIPDFDYAREDFDFPKQESNASARYLAFVLNASGELALADLGPAARLEEAAQLVLKDARDLNPTQWRPHLANLYTQLWAPLQSALGNADKLTISPDGVLNLVPFAALVDTDGRFLLERYHLAYASTGRDLLTIEQPRGAPTSALLLVANPAFDAEVSGAASYAAAFRSRDWHQSFKPLSGTEREASEIPPLVPGSKDQVILVGTKATEAAVKRAKSPRILHLATHGFFLPDQGFGMDEARYENALVRSGLALAGANRAAQAVDGDDGLLTALEVSDLDLSGTYLVVLSACDTGTGEVKVGEGVVGLRRAFALAGARNVMMSLWRVSDRVTADQMELFYSNLPTMPPPDALRQAQLQTIRELTAKDGAAPPGLWAPFIVQGGHAFSHPK